MAGIVTSSNMGARWVDCVCGGGGGHVFLCLGGAVCD